MLAFLFIWLGQLISLTGSGLSSFALGVQVFQQAGSATSFALISFCTSMPGIFISPIAGALVDRWDRRRTLLIADLGAGLCTLMIAVLVLHGSLRVWHVYAAATAGAICGTFRRPALLVLTTQWVPPRHLGRALGMVEMAHGTSLLLAPALAAVLIGVVRISGIVLIDFVSFLIAVVTLLPSVLMGPAAAPKAAVGRNSLLQEVALGAKILLAHRSLLGILVLEVLVNFAMGIVTVLITPLLLSFSSARALGTVTSVAGLGMLAGSLLMSVWGGPRRKMHGVLGFGLLKGALLVIGGLQSSLPLITVAAFGVLFTLPTFSGCAQFIWQRKVDSAVQGRLLALRSTAGTAALALAYLAAGPLADRVFEPPMAQRGYLAASLGPLLGVGPGRGIGLLFIVLGFLVIMAILIAASIKELTQVESTLPDIRPDIPAAAVAKGEEREPDQPIAAAPKAASVIPPT